MRKELLSFPTGPVKFSYAYRPNYFVESSPVFLIETEIVPEPGFTHIANWFTKDQVMQIRAACDEWLNLEREENQ